MRWPLDAVHAKVITNDAERQQGPGAIEFAIEERKSWTTDHNKAVKAEMKTGAESDEAADMLVNSLLSEGELVFGGIESDRNQHKSKAWRKLFEERTCVAWDPSVADEASMLGIIMAGGKGTRLMPLTSTDRNLRGSPWSPSHRLRQRSHA